MEGFPESPRRQAPAQEDDDALVARARAGDVEAFRGLVDAHRDRVYGLALRVVRSAHDAEEIAQDAFVRAWRALPQFRGDARFSTWLFRITMRRALDAASALKRKHAREVGLETIESMPEAAGRATHDAAAARRLETMIAALPEAYRLTVTLHYYDERSVEEIADILDTPAGTVKTHLFRARARLREMWRAAEETPQSGGARR